MTTTSSDTFEAQLSVHANRLLKTHETLLRDTVRNRAFYDALSRNVTESSVVLDIGSGSGVWAISAAKLGARRVVALERDELMVGVIKQLAIEHNVAERVEVIWGSSYDVSLEKEFDVVVTETIGYLGYDENIVAIMCDVRRRFLKSGGALIPETVSLYAAAGRLRTRLESVPAGLPFDFEVLRRLNLHAPFVLRTPSDVELLTQPACLIDTDLREAADEPSLQNVTAAWSIKDLGEIDCFAVWVESRLTEGVRLSTLETASWRPMIYRIEPLGPNYTHLEFSFTMKPGNSCVSVTATNESDSVSRRYAPDLAATEMILSARAGGNVIGLNGRTFPRPAQPSQPPVCIRQASDDDRDFLFQVYCESRKSEVAQFGWSTSQAEEFLQMQFGIRERSYQMQFAADAEQSVILYDSEPAGSMIVARTGKSIIVVDIAVAQNYRNKGIASYLIKQLQKEASAAGGTVSLHVDKANQHALRLYRNLGFAVVDETALQYEMKWTQQD